jgi:hypothetical protein
VLPLLHPTATRPPHKPSAFLRRTALRVVCILLILYGIAGTIRHGVLPGDRVFFDFKVFYAGGLLWRQHGSPYDPTRFWAELAPLNPENPAFNAERPVYFYPPSGSALFAALTWLPIETAARVMLVANVALLVLALVLLGRILSWFRPLGLVEIAFLANLPKIGLFVALRNSQWGILVLVLLLATFMLERSGRQLAAGVSLALTSFKPSFGPFYGLYYILRGNWLLAATAGIGVVGLTILPLLATGRPVLETLLAFKGALEAGHAPGQYLSADPGAAFTITYHMIHLKVLVLRLFGSPSLVAEATAALAVAALLAAAAWVMRRPPRDEEERLLDFAIVSALAATAVYHHAYDLFLMLPGLLCLYLRAAADIERHGSWRWAAVLLILFLLFTQGSSLVGSWLATSPELRDWPLARALLLLPWLVLALVLILLQLRRTPEAAVAGQPC